jgi:hypothetical protein
MLPSDAAEPPASTQAKGGREDRDEAQLAAGLPTRTSFLLEPW